MQDPDPLTKSQKVERARYRAFVTLEAETLPCMDEGRLDKRGFSQIGAERGTTKSQNRG